jgi:signal transduction histidine kinase
MIGLATAVTIVWALFVRWSNVEEPFFVDWGGVEWLEPYFVGVAIQELVAPVGLVYLFSRTALFRRIITRVSPEQDGYKLLAVLIGIQAVTFLYRFGLIRASEEQVTLGLFVVLAAGLLGGWRAGLGVGAFTLLTIGWLDYVVWLDPNELFELPVYFEYYVLKHMNGATAVWLGAVVGLAAMAWEKWRYRPGFAAGLTAIVLSVTFWFNAYSDYYPPFFIERWLPNVVVLGLATAVFTLIIRNVQDEEARRQAETTQLELTQINLTLTQTRLALAQAELRALHAQINPHFFFNTLNTIRYFIRIDPDAARDLLIKLSEIFQRALSAGEFVPLRDEIAYVEAYLALEKAVIHGISTQPEGGALHIVINRVGDDLLIQVDDDGAGFDVVAAMADPTTPGETTALPLLSTNVPVRQSIGLRNVDERLRMLYGDDYRLQIESEPGNGTRVVFKIPISSRQRLQNYETARLRD